MVISSDLTQRTDGKPTMSRNTLASTPSPARPRTWANTHSYRSPQRQRRHHLTKPLHRLEPTFINIAQARLADALSGGEREEGMGGSYGGELGFSPSRLRGGDTRERGKRVCTVYRLEH
jgi:hypothetical protein